MAGMDLALSGQKYMQNSPPSKVIAITFANLAEIVLGCSI
jgi:hypothetical protein